MCTVNAAESFELKKLNNALGFRFRSLVIKEEIPSWEKRFFPQNILNSKINDTFEITLRTFIASIGRFQIQFTQETISYFGLRIFYNTGRRP